MTNYEFYKAIAENAITEEVITKAKAYVDREDAVKAEKAKAQAEFDRVVLEALTHATELVTSTELAESMEDSDYTPGKVNKALQRLIAAECVVKIEGKPNQYRVA